MITVPVVGIDGQQIRTVEIDAAEFGGTVNRQLLHDAVVMYEANRRVGTHYTKRRSDVVGSKRKLFRQKGTGNARVGARRTNKRRGGGTTKGPRPRDYSFRLPRNARRLATRMALLSKFQDNEALVVEGLTLTAPKTHRMSEILKSLNPEGESCLIATDGVDRNVHLSARNIRGVETLPCNELFARAVLRHKRLLLTDTALAALRRTADANADKTPAATGG